MDLKLAYTALSPFCRKVRMAMEYKGIEFSIVPGDHITEVPAFNPRAEVPVLIDGLIVVCNSPDVLAYVDRKFARLPLYPADAAAYAQVRQVGAARGHRLRCDPYGDRQLEVRGATAHAIGPDGCGTPRHRGALRSTRRTAALWPLRMR